MIKIHRPFCVVAGLAFGLVCGRDAHSSGDEHFFVGIGYGLHQMKLTVPSGTSVGVISSGTTTEAYSGGGGNLSLQGMWRPSGNFGLGLDLGSTSLGEVSYGGLTFSTYLSQGAIRPTWFSAKRWFQFGIDIGYASLRQKLDVVWASSSVTVKNYFYVGPYIALNIRFSDLISIGAEGSAHYINAGVGYGFSGIGMLKFWFG